MLREKLASLHLSGNTDLQLGLKQDSFRIMKGAVGERVRLVQVALEKLRSAKVFEFKEPIAASGKFDETTRKAVLAYKTKRQIINPAYQRVPDDIVGKMTLERLDNDMLAFEQQNALPPTNLIFEDRDILLFFTGVVDNLGMGGKELPSDPHKHGQDVLDEMQKLKPKSGSTTSVRGFGGSLQNDDGIASALEIINTTRDSANGKLIIYGFSAGGKNALDLCRKLENNKYKTVDLLVTVDAAARFGSVNRNVSPVVKRNVNFWQSTYSFSTSRGAPNNVVAGTIYKDVNCDSRFTYAEKKARIAHKLMDQRTRDDAVAAMKEELER